MPESEIFKTLLQTGSAGAVIVVVVIFTRFLADERRDRAQEREGVWRAIDRLSEAVEKLSIRLDEAFHRD